MPTYLYTDLETSLKGRLHNQLGQIAGGTTRTMINDGVRQCLEIDFRSTKRKSTIAPNLFNEIYQYTCPTDLKKKKVIGIQPQKLDRSRHQAYSLVPEENFDQLKQSRTNLISFTDRDFTRKLLASVDVNDDSLVVSPLDALTGSGSWALFGDGTNLSADTYEYIKGSGSIKWDISAAGGTTAGIQASNIPVFDVTKYFSAGSAFVWAYITSATNLTNYKLRIGNDSSNYYEMTTTTTNEGTTFVAGWNLLRFDFSGKTTTGTVTKNACDYAVIYMTKTAGKVSETDYRFDNIILKLGEINNLIYYSKYLWQNTGGTWIENSTADTDKLNLDTDEYDIVVAKCIEWISAGIREYENDYVIAKADYKEKKKEYQKQYKSEALMEQTDYYYFNS